MSKLKVELIDEKEQACLVGGTNLGCAAGFFGLGIAIMSGPAAFALGMTAVMAIADQCN